MQSSILRPASPRLPAEPHLELLWAAFAQDAEANGVAWAVVVEQGVEVVEVLHRLRFERNDDVVGLEARLLGRGVRLDIFYQDALRR